jgi:hypothetical protein
MRIRAEIQKLLLRAILLAICLCVRLSLQSQAPTHDSLEYYELSTRLRTEYELFPDPDAYTFLAGGHWYGSHENSLSRHPSSTLYAGLGVINAQHPDWIFILGDVVRDANDPLQVRAFNDLKQKLVGNHQVVPGNHDLSRDQFYEPGLGPKADYLIHKGDPYIFLNTESLRFGGGRAMLHLLQDISGKIKNNSSPNLFVFSHRLLWALAEPGFLEMDDFANQPFAPQVNADTVQMIYDAVLKLAEKRTLHWFSGDIGASWSETAFYDHSVDNKRHFYAAGLGDCVDDAIWSVRVNGKKQVSAKLLMLNGYNPHDLDYYSLEGWRKRMQARQGFGESSLGKKIKEFLLVPKFWIGLGLGVLLTLGISGLWRRLRSVKSSRPQ